MATNPYTKSLRVSYQPLNLAPVAQAAAQNQQGFDTVTAEAQAAEFALSALDKDDPRRKALIEKYEGKTEELVSNLMKEGDWRKANQKLMTLNKEWNRDKERQLIAAKYAEFQEKDKIAKDLFLNVKNMDTYNPNRYKQWRAYELGNYQGINYNQETGEYTHHTFGDRFQDVTQELQEKAIELAEGAPEQVYERISKFYGTGVAYQLQRKIETVGYKNAQQMAAEIMKVLASTKKYKYALAQDAQYDIYFRKQNYLNYMNNYLGIKAKEFLDYREKLEEVEPVDENGKPLKGAALEEFNAQLQKAKEKLKEKEDEFKYNLNTRREAFLAEEYTKDFYNQTLSRIAAGAADMFDYENVKTDFDYITDDYSLRRSLDKAKKKDESQGVLTSSTVDPVTAYNKWIKENTNYFGQFEDPLTGEIKLASEITMQDYTNTQVKISDNKLADYESSLKIAKNAGNQVEVEKLEGLIRRENTNKANLLAQSRAVHNKSAIEAGYNNVYQVQNSGPDQHIDELIITDSSGRNLKSEFVKFMLGKYDYGRTPSGNVYTFVDKNTGKWSNTNAVVQDFLKSKGVNIDILQGTNSGDMVIGEANKDVNLKSLRKSYNTKLKLDNRLPSTTSQGEELTMSESFLNQGKVQSVINSVAQGGSPDYYIEYQGDDGNWYKSKRRTFSPNDMQGVRFDRATVGGNVVMKYNLLDSSKSTTEGYSNTDKDGDRSDKEGTTTTWKRDNFTKYRVVLNPSASSNIKTALREVASNDAEITVLNSWDNAEIIERNNEMVANNVGVPSEQVPISFNIPGQGRVNLGNMTINTKPSSNPYLFSEQVVEVDLYDNSGAPLLNDKKEHISWQGTLNELNNFTTNINEFARFREELGL